MTDIVMTHDCAVILSMGLARVMNLLKTIFTRYTIGISEWHVANL